MLHNSPICQRWTINIKSYQCGYSCGDFYDSRRIGTSKLLLSRHYIHRSPMKHLMIATSLSQWEMNRSRWSKFIMQSQKETTAYFGPTALRSVAPLRIFLYAERVLSFSHQIVYNRNYSGNGPMCNMAVTCW